jgi:hypothetical protein
MDSKVYEQVIILKLLLVPLFPVLMFLSSFQVSSLSLFRLFSFLFTIFCIQSRRNKGDFLQMAAPKHIKRFSLKQVAERKTEVNFSISHHKNSTLQISQKHFINLTRKCSLFLLCDLFSNARGFHTAKCQLQRKKHGCECKYKHG